nr:germin-like protein subfamily 3 member 2 [Ipomoea batatas]
MFSTKMTVFLVLLLQSCIVLASDPDPLHDYCIPIPEFSSIFPSCKNSSLVTVEDFVYSGIKNPGDFKNTGFASIPVNSAVFPGLHTLGMSFVRADFEAGGINVPHYHPRATETAFVLEGRVYAGFVDSSNRVFARVLEKGEVMVFPRGLVHFQMNVGDSPASILGSFNSQNPGSVKIPNVMFGSSIKEEVLMKAFGLNDKEVHKLRKRFVPQ